MTHVIPRTCSPRYTEHTLGDLIMTESFDRVKVGEIVSHDFRAAAVFEQYGIDFCCGGRRSLAEACRAAGADPSAVAQGLDALPPVDTSDDDVTQWSVERLIDHIVTTHHAYIRSAIPLIGRYLAKLVEVHGARHPELNRIAVSFDQMGNDLLQHMMKEERVLFPYIRELATTTDRATPASPFGTVENPIRMMEREHRDAGEETR